MQPEERIYSFFNIINLPNPRPSQTTGFLQWLLSGYWVAIEWLLCGYWVATGFLLSEPIAYPNCIGKSSLQQGFFFNGDNLSQYVPLGRVWSQMRWAVRILTSTEDPMYWHHTEVKYACVWSKSYHLQAHNICIAVGLLLFMPFQFSAEIRLKWLLLQDKTLHHLKLYKVKVGLSYHKLPCNPLS